MSDIDGYVAQSTMFLDFTVISLTFRKGDKDTVLAVVSDPIDVFGGFTTQTDLTRDNTKDGNWSLIERLLTFFFSIMMIVLLFVVLCLIFPGVFSAAVSLLGVVFSFLFKMIAAPFRWINKALRKKE